MINLPPEFHKRSLCFSNESSDWKLTVDQLSAALSGIQVKSGLLPSSVGRGGLETRALTWGPPATPQADPQGTARPLHPPLQNSLPAHKFVLWDYLQRK